MDKILTDALANTNKALDYYNNTFAKRLSDLRIRNEAANIGGILAYRKYLLAELAELNKEKPKRGNPNFGKNNPYNTAKKATGGNE